MIALCSYLTFFLPTPSLLSVSLPGELGSLFIPAALLPPPLLFPCLLFPHFLPSPPPPRPLVQVGPAACLVAFGRSRGARQDLHLSLGAGTEAPVIATLGVGALGDRPAVDHAHCCRVKIEKKCRIFNHG